MFKKIVVAFDGSAHSEEALRKAVEVADESGHLTILSVAPHPTSWIVGGQMGVAFGSEELQKEIDTSWNSQLEQALATVPDGVRSRADTKLTHGSAGPSIAEEAAAGDYDLLIVGSRGHSALGGLFLGSVSLHLAHASPIPILIVQLKEKDTDS
jgi:nucleotide-binding universal stress UspA family protein